MVSAALPIDGIEDWFTKNRGNVGTIASVIATMSLQNSMNPPGGFQNVNNGSVLCPTPMVHGEACPGQSVFAVMNPVGYIAFMLVNIISFLISVIAFIIIITGMSLKLGAPSLTVAVGSMCLSPALLLASFGIKFRFLNPYASEIFGEIATYGSLTTLLVFSYNRVHALTIQVVPKNLKTKKKEEEELKTKKKKEEEEKLKTKKKEEEEDGYTLD